MRIAITGATGFIGRHLAERLIGEGHELVLIARSCGTTRTEWKSPSNQLVSTDLSDVNLLTESLAGCEVIAHCAGINREIGRQTYQKVHIEATQNLADAARAAGVRKIVLMSFLRARPACGSPYHESKWAAEEIARASGLDYTIVRAGMVYGRGDHMLDHLSHALYTFPLFAMVGLEEKAIRPLAIEDLLVILRAAIVDGRIVRKTVAVTGAEELYLSEAVRRVARVVGKRVKMVPAPIWSHYLLARFCEWTMKVPLVALAQVRILSEGVVEPALPCDPLPYDLLPTRMFTEAQIRRGLPKPGPFGLGDLRWCTARWT